MMASFSVLIVTLTILSLSVNPAFARVTDRNFPPEANVDSVHFISFYPVNFNSSTSLSFQFNFKIDNGVALVIIPADFYSKFARNMSFELLDAHQFLGVKFYGNVCKISSSGVTNVSKISNVLKDGVNLTSWIEYQPISKRLEVKLGRLDDPKRVELISVPVDLGEILKGEEVMLGLACSKEKHKQVTSWSLQIKDFPYSLFAFADYLEHSPVQNFNKEGAFLIIFGFNMFLMGYFAVKKNSETAMKDVSFSPMYY